MDTLTQPHAIREAAKTTQVAPHLYDFVDRDQIDMPSYCSSAPGVLVVAKDTLAATRRSRRSSRPLEWTRGFLFDGWQTQTADGSAVLWVQRRGRYWFVGRITTRPHGEQILCCAFAGAPFCARTSAAAMRFAEHCHPLPQTIAGCWTPIVFPSGN
jgi:hypothetical protein